ncbi:DUF1634 domain-containing protein [Leptolyngbya boryana CZ1]|uniref:DUF1634 domain-containing protein n=1 Tax=Leptolyngbya boryana CZ1 TaxID=3060204 RepID=A0AA97AYL2_LEPBY|nr:DUF1634 domain-containing protein [Leptolyngbya boryana]WNZ48506.1 DUF1634 domain-containing protein [Leptolyngbya boryana CZ1]
MYKDLIARSNSSSDETLDRLQEAKLELWISNLLRYGVQLSSLIVLVGGILYLIHHHAEPVDYRVFQGEPAIYRSPSGVVQALLEGHRRGIIQLGLLVLIATPILRVLLSLVTFLRWRDYTYAAITFLVLSGLIYSFVGAYF